MSRRINLCFSGWINGYRLTNVTVTETDEEIRIHDGYCDEEIIANLNSGKWVISLTDALSDNENAEVEVFDYEIPTI